MAYHVQIHFPICIYVNAYPVCVYAFSHQLSEQWRSWSHHNLLFSSSSGSHDYRDNTIYIWIHVQEKAATISLYNKQCTHFKCRHKTTDVNVSLCLKWWSKFDKMLLQLRYMLHYAGLWLCSVQNGLWQSCHRYSKSIWSENCKIYKIMLLFRL